MGVSESKTIDAVGASPPALNGSDSVSLSSLRSQFTSSKTMSLDQATLGSARFRQEERLRGDLRREKRIRQQAMDERIAAMKDSVATDLAVSHELTMDALEKEMREDMEQELAEMERESLTREEGRMRMELDLRLNRQLDSLREGIEVEQDRRLVEHKEQIKSNIEAQLQQEHRQRLDIQKERLSLEYNQELQRRVREIEGNIEVEMETRFKQMESAEINRLEEGHIARLAEREEQLRRGIRTRLEQQLRGRLKQREARLKSEYERRSLRLEEDIAQQLQEELEGRLRQETDDLEENMREDVELAIARRRDELRVEIARQLEERHSERLSERKSRLREKYDITFSKAVDDISHSLKTEVESELDLRMEEEFTNYRSAREAEIQNRLARFRYDRESELRDQLGAQYEAKKVDWSERLELEFQSRESAARKAIMSEVDAGLRNERLTFETDLDLLKEETSLELEIDMEERLNDFKARKENEVATQLERQLDKREEIMRNKALIDVRKREAAIRAEIEAQLGLKRAEIRDRLSGLSEKMDSFKEMAEEKMRDAVTNQIQGEIDSEQSVLQSREQEFQELQTQDNKVDKRQTWMQAISGQGTQGMQATGMDPFALGARQGAQSGGRALGGTLGAAAQQHQPRMGLAGMRSPTTSAKPLSSALSMARPVKSPLVNQQTSAAAASALPEPIHQRVVRSPIIPIQPQVQPVTQIEQSPTIVQSTSIPVEPIEQVEEIVAEQEIAEIDIEDEIAEIDIEDEITEVILEELVTELEDEPRTALLNPITTKLSIANPQQQKAVSLTPVRQLQPVNKTESPAAMSGPPVSAIKKPAAMSGPPVSSVKKPAAMSGPPVKMNVETAMATLIPIKKRTPLKIERKKMQPSKEEDN
jgi:hypothetical protein